MTHDELNEALESVRVQVLHTEPGDMVVLSFPERLSPEAVDRMKRAWAFIRPDVTCAVLDSGGHVDSIVRAS